MALLEGKTALVFGVANDRSIAWGIARQLKEHGCTLGFTYVNESIGRRAKPLAESVGAEFVEECDVADDSRIERLFKLWKEKYGSLDILIHAVAFADRSELKGEFFNTSRAGFHLAMDISVYSLVNIVKHAAPLMENRSGSIITLSYYGAEKVVKNYNVMGVAKAALEASVRYLAADLGPMGIRINALSAGPIKTLAASGIGDFRSMLKHHAATAPMRRNVTTEDVGKSALYLCSDLASGVTGELVHVDGGYNIMGSSPKPEPQ
ncbi:MAG: enoyl-[acyl-carrier-protein] reductase [NADH] [bacterium]|nr:MAG: enoyl-[acyl-carrier-protein] reductase [NADH] [bacterium]